MTQTISLGVMEQKSFRKEGILTQEEEQTAEEILQRVNHVEFKYLDSIATSQERVQLYGGGKEVLIHAQYPSAGEGSLNFCDPEFRIKFNPETITSQRPHWVSFHLGFSGEKLIGGGQYDFDRLESQEEVLPKDEVYSRIIQGITWLKKTLGLPVLLENLDYNPARHYGKWCSGAYEYVTHPQFILDVVKDTGCGLLLDAGHAEASARNMPYPGVGDPDVKSYMAPLRQHIVEVHMSGPGEKNGLAHDSHRPIDEEGQNGIEYLEFILNNAPRIKAVTLETFIETGDVPAQLDLLREIIERAGYKIAPLRGN